MEANYLEVSKSSSEETDKSEQSNDDIRTGRTYECVFCKRGFTTAQALGGHMNIHRKDRAKSRPSSVPILVSTNKVDDPNYPSLKSYYQPHFSIAPHEVHVSYQAFFPVSAGWGFRSPPHTAELFVDDSRHVSLRIGPSQENKKPDHDHGSIEEDELDLELRLGQ